MILIICLIILLIKVEVEGAAVMFSKLSQSGEFFFLLLYRILLSGPGWASHTLIGAFFF